MSSPTKNTGLSRFLPKILRESVILQRTLLFVLGFVLVSGLTGSWIIATNKLLFPFYFGIYGSAGKSLIFGVVALLLLLQEKLLRLPVERWSFQNTRWWILAVTAVAGFFLVGPQLLNYQRGSEAPILTLVAHGFLWLAAASVFLGSFGSQFVRHLWRQGRNELLVTAALATLFYFLFGWIFTLWPYLSKIVLWAVLGMLQFTNPGAILVPPLTIHLPEFAVTIGEYCSGIESLFLITTLYILIGCLEWRRAHRWRFFLNFFPLIIGMFALNIVRVFVIIQAGVVLNPTIAAKLFHTYLGMLLFMGYFLLYWRWTAPIVLRRQVKSGKENI